MTLKNLKLKNPIFVSNVHLLAMFYILDHKSSVILNFADIFAFAVGGLIFFAQEFCRREKLLPYEYRKILCPWRHHDET